MNLLKSVLAIVLVFTASVHAEQEYVVEDQGVGLTHEELSQLVKFWTPEMKAAAARSDGDRLELINLALTNKKLAEQFNSFSVEDNPEAYWKHVFSVRNMNRQFVVSQYLESLEVPDMSALAEERYHSVKEKMAFVPETRSSSHILLLCLPGECDREARRPEAMKILAELDAGADFTELATKYSEDPGSKDKGGKFEKWMKLGEANVAPRYTGGLFAIDKIGGYSGLVETRFGIHIIRLDDIREEYYKPFSEVKDDIVLSLEQEFKSLSAKEYDARFRITEKAFINGKAMDEIFNPAGVDGTGN